MLRPVIFCLAGFSAIMVAAAPSFSVGVLHDDNVANSTGSEFADSAFTTGIEFSTLRIINRDWQGNLHLAASTTHWQKWNGLDLTPLSVRAGLRRKFGLGPLAPRLDLSVEAGRRFAATPERTSNIALSKLTYSQRLNAALLWNLSAEIERHDARRYIYSTTRHAFRLGAEWDANQDWRASFSVSYGRGDLISWCPPQVAGFFADAWEDDIFTEGWFPYQTINNISSTHLSLSRALGPRTSVTVSADFSRSAGTKKIHVYYNNILSLQLIHAF